MVVYPVGEPHFFQVFFESPELVVVAVARIAQPNGFERTAYGKVIPAVLVEKDIPAAEGRLVEVIDQQFFVQFEGIETGNLITQYPYIVETIGNPRESFGSRLILPAAGTERR